MSESLVLLNATEAKSKLIVIANTHKEFREKLYEFYVLKGHVALRYEDTFDGLYQCVKEHAHLSYSKDAIQAQIGAAEVSAEVGKDVPIAIGRQLVKLPVGQRKAIYDEVIGAREKAGQRSANQMEPDVRRVVAKELRAAAGPIGTGTPATYAEAQAATAVDFGLVPAQEARTADLEVEVPNYAPTGELNYQGAFRAARRVLCDFVAAYGSGDKESELGAYMNAKIVLTKYEGF